MNDTGGPERPTMPSDIRGLCSEKVRAQGTDGDSLTIFPGFIFSLQFSVPDMIQADRGACCTVPSELEPMA